MKVTYNWKHPQTKAVISNDFRGEKGAEEQLLCVRGCGVSQGRRDPRGAHDRHLDMRAKQVKSWKEKVTIDNTAERSENFKWLLNSEVGNGLPVAATVTVATVALIRAGLEEGQDWAPGRGQERPGGTEGRATGRARQS